MKFLKLFAWLFLFYSIVLEPGSFVDAAKVQTQKLKGQWRLLIDNEPFFVRGMCYFTVKVGESSDEGTIRDWMLIDDDQNGKVDSAYQSWLDRNHNNRKDRGENEVGDFELLKQMGCNTIRIYHHPSSSPWIQSLYKNQKTARSLFGHNSEPNKRLLRDLFNSYGIVVAMGDLLGAYTVGSGADWRSGTDYRDPEQRKNMMKSALNMVREFKDEPYVLMWILGNENNNSITHTNAGKFPKHYYLFVNEVARKIKEIDPNHPISISNWDLNHIEDFTRFSSEVDILGINSYRNPEDEDFWRKIQQYTDKPVLMTEYGTPHPELEGGILNEYHQADQFGSGYCSWVKNSAEGNPGGPSIGGFIYNWLDDWSQNGDPYTLNLSTITWNNEWTGIMGQGDGLSSPFLRQARLSYDRLKLLWTGEIECQQRF